MANLKRCDKCKKLIKKNKYIGIQISDAIGITGEECTWLNLDLCEKCGILDFKKLQKIFPKLNDKK
jgi:hypothetical protein